ncbi:hypothetical protein F383_34865 [Gossypium arboreum]|uniref:Uncharacterized protein n=2 Tax=Gossypium arboreum TaxID=29729 RepID=A0A0B0PV07_GOSAR|nr:hypothetical protein F383_34865 [Gossypium arboreum]
MNSRFTMFVDIRDFGCKLRAWGSSSKSSTLSSTFGIFYFRTYGMYRLIYILIDLGYV